MFLAYMQVNSVYLCLCSLIYRNHIHSMVGLSDLVNIMQMKHIQMNLHSAVEQLQQKTFNLNVIVYLYSLHLMAY